MRFIFYIVLIFTLANCERSVNNYKTWEVRGGDKKQDRYSSLTQIDTSNVTHLEIAWKYETGDAGHSSQIEANPIVINGTLYSTSPKLKLFALNAKNGKEEWTFDPFKNVEKDPSLHANRGVTYWSKGDSSAILFTAGSNLYKVDTKTGKPVSSFGINGKVSLKKGFQKQFKDFYAVATSPGIIYNNLIIIGSRVSEGGDAAPGDIRAFDVYTGDLKWIFHTIPHPGEVGYKSWDDPQAWKQVGGANSWAGMALDEERGIVYVPTGSVSPDFYGGNRKGKDLFGNSLIALDAASGKHLWHYQTVHHDLWDRDLPSPPSLVTVNYKGNSVDAVAQTTKTGFVFLFNRITGEPLFDIREQSVPTSSSLKDENPWPHQPIPVKPSPLLRQQVNKNDINPYIPVKEQDKIRAKLKQLHKTNMFTPPSNKARILFPGFDGGAEWGGSAFDPETGLLYVNTNEIPWILQIIDKQIGDKKEGEPASIKAGHKIFLANCAGCHGAKLSGSGRSPSLINVGKRRSPDSMLQLINNGKGMMPAFDQIPMARKKAIINFLIGKSHYQIDAEKISEKQEVVEDPGLSEPYTLNGYQKFRTADGYPAVSPPWGRLNAVNLNTGNIVWQVPLGEYPKLRDKGIPTTGTENYGGPVVTKGGLVFIAATLDHKIRAFNKKTGKLLWEAKLPYAGFATPSVYEADGKEFIVIACGGGKLGQKSGDAYVAFSLSSKKE